MKPSITDIAENHKKVREVLDSSVIVDCCIIEPHRFALMLVKDMGDKYDPWKMLPPVSLAIYNSQKGGWAWSKFKKNNFRYPKVVHLPEKDDALIVCNAGQVYYYGLGENKHWETNIPSGVNDIKNIHGTVYVVGVHREVLRRDGANRWTHISEKIQKLSISTYDLAKQKGGHFSPGFDRIDGFAADKDLYAGGGNGDVWHYDGQKWRSVDIPLPQMQISGICCCASDGYVYIAGRYGALLKGRDDEWHTLKHEKTRSDFRDIAEYNGKVYVCTEGNLYTIEGETIEPVNFGAMGKPFSFSALYANHGLLLVSGSYSACLFDGQAWTSIYGNSKVDEMLELNLISHVADQLEDMVDKLGDLRDAIKPKG